VKRWWSGLLAAGACAGTLSSAARAAPAPEVATAPAASKGDLQSPDQADTRHSAYSLPRGTWGLGISALGVGGGDVFAKLGASYGFGSGLEAGVNLAHLGVGLLNLSVAWHFVDTRHFDLGLRAGFWYGRGEWFWTAEGLAERIVSNLDVLNVPFLLTASVPVAHVAQFDLGLQYTYAQLLGSGANSDQSSPFSDAELAQRQLFFRPGARWFIADNTALEVSTKLPVYTSLALKGSSPELPFSETWAFEAGLRSRFAPDVFGNLRVHYGTVSKALYGSRVFPAMEVEMRF
jgi:hypothetical protein